MLLIAFNDATKHLLSRLRILARLCASESGNAVVEFALGVSFLLAPLLLGTSELGFIIYESIEVSNAAHAGAVYGSYSNTYAADTTGIQTIARSEAADFGTALTVTSSTYYACSQAMTGTQYSTSTAAAAVCPSTASSHYLYFVKVNTTASFAPPIRIPGLPTTWTLTGSSVMEVPQS
jgi:Flp pilus assembly protein TadG